MCFRLFLIFFYCPPEFCPSGQNSGKATLTFRKSSVYHLQKLFDQSFVLYRGVVLDNARSSILQKFSSFLMPPKRKVRSLECAVAPAPHDAGVLAPNAVAAAAVTTPLVPAPHAAGVLSPKAAALTPNAEAAAAVTTPLDSAPHAAGVLSPNAVAAAAVTCAAKPTTAKVEKPARLKGLAHWDPVESLVHISSPLHAPSPTAPRPSPPTRTLYTPCVIGGNFIHDCSERTSFEVGRSLSHSYCGKGVPSAARISLWS